MSDLLTILLALAIFLVLVAIFGFVAWKINMSDPLGSESLAKKDDNHVSADSAHSRKKKDKSGSDGKKKRKEAKKSKSKNRADEDEQQSANNRKEATPVPSDDTENEADVSEEAPSTPPMETAEVTLTLTKRQKKRNRQNTSSPGATGGILVNRDEKSPVTDHPQPIPHPKLAIMIPKDEVELAKLHHQSSNQARSTPSSTKPVSAAKKPAPAAAAASNDAQGARQPEQPFTTVGNNRHKSGATVVPPQQQQQQRHKPVAAAAAAVTATPAPAPPPPTAAPAAAASTPPPPPPPAPAQQPVVTKVPHEPLAQRHPARSHREAPPAQVNGFNRNAAANKPAAASAQPMKITDMFKALPTSQAVVSELMSALDAYPLSADELNIVMHKIANKQAVINKDWTKLQHGQKVDPQAHMGQVLDESAKAAEEDMRTNAMKRIKDLSDELNNEKRRIHDLLREKDEKDKTVQMLRNQLDAFQHHQNSAQMNNQQQQQFQTMQLQVQRLTEENIQLTQRLSQQQQHQQHHFPQQSMNPNDATNTRIRLLQDQIEKVSIQNGDYEKKLKANVASIEKSHKEKDELLRANQKLSQAVQQLQQGEEKLSKELKEIRSLHSSQINEWKHRLDQSERENEQLRRVELQSAAPTNNEEREQLQRDIEQLKQTLGENLQRFEQQQIEYQQIKQQLTHETGDHQKRLDELQSQFRDRENTLQQEIEQLKQEKNVKNSQQNESLTAQLDTKNAEVDALRAELADVKATSDSIQAQNNARLDEEKKKNQAFLVNLLTDDVRGHLPENEQNYDQWLSSYRQIFESSIDAQKRKISDESVVLKQENEQLRQNMRDAESQLMEIEKAVQTKEEALVTDLRERDVTLTSIQQENERLRQEIQRLRSDHDSAANEIRSLKELLEERAELLNHQPPSTVSTNEGHADEATASSDQQHQSES